MRENLDQSLTWTLAYEGGYVNDPDDPGGPTNKGVTQRVYDGYRKGRGLALRSVRLITADEVAEIYKKQYWDAVRGDDLPDGLDFAVWDFGVNSGPSRAIKELQKVLGVRVDGVIGEITLSKARTRDPVEVIAALCAARLKFCQGLKGWKKYGNGWERRIIGEMDGVQTTDMGVVDRAVWLITKDQDIAVPMPAPAPGKAEQPPRASLGQSTQLRALIFDNAAKIGGFWAVYQQLDPVTRYTLLAVVVISVGLGAYAMRERVKAWADGWR